MHGQTNIKNIKFKDLEEKIIIIFQQGSLPSLGIKQDSMGRRINFASQLSCEVQNLL